MQILLRRIVLPASLLLASSSLAAGAADPPASPAPAYWAFAPLPPMGWNSYDVYGGDVTEQETLANAKYMKDHLYAHGWRYVVIDFRWYDSVLTINDGNLRDRLGAKLAADQYGRLLPSESRFPSSANGVGFKPVADQVHGMGLKFGIHIMRGIPRQTFNAKSPIEGSTFTAADAGNPNSICRWNPDMFGVLNNAAGQAWYDSIFRQYAAWGLDFVKVDDLSAPYYGDEIAMIRKAIDKSGRAIVFSTSPGGTNPSHADDISHQANMWRISGDFWDEWKKLDSQFDNLGKWQGVGGPGHFPDADMIPFGHIAIRNWTNAKDHTTRFTHDEQIMLISLWSLNSSPLMLGMNLPDDDDFTTSLLSNDEVLALDQDPLGLSAKRIVQPGGIEIWVKNLKDGSKAIGLFNRSAAEASAALNWKDAGLDGKQRLRDLWLHKDLGTFNGTFSTTVPSHGVVLLRTRHR